MLVANAANPQVRVAQLVKRQLHPRRDRVGARELVLMAPGLVYVERLIPIDMCAAVTNP